MATTPQQIDIWRQSRFEHQRLEFKEAKTQYDNTKLYKYCVALANEGGGFIVLGVADRPPARCRDSSIQRSGRNGREALPGSWFSRGH